MNKTVVCFGEVLLRLSAPGKELLLQSPRFDAHVGGAEANVAVSLTKLGHRAAVVTALPDSTLGRACADELRRHGVSTDAIVFRPGRMGMYFLTHGAGHRPAEVLYDRSHSAFATAPRETYAWSDALAGAAWLHVSGITPAVSPSAATAALDAMTAARKAGLGVSFDCNFRARLWGDRSAEAPGLLRKLCEQADVVFGDDRDIAFMLGEKSVEGPVETRKQRAAKAAFGAFAHLRFIAFTERTRQSADVQQITGMLHGPTQPWSSRAYPLYGIVDRIGAGDAFAAGVLHGLIGGFDAQKCVDFGTAAACLKHSIPGDFNLVGAADVELLLSQHRMDVRR
jgi:2-dehydro-3-deoxygluconokinase